MGPAPSPPTNLSRGPTVVQRTCSIDGCERRGNLVRGWCHSHYSRWRRHGDPLASLYRGNSLISPSGPVTSCSIDGCEKQAEARGWCDVHYTRWKRHGDPLTSLLHVGESCSMAGCEQSYYALGLCATHYESLRRLRRRNTGSDGSCAIDGCDKTARARGMCHTHYTGWLRDITPEYHIWAGMKSRCKDMNNPKYGGRGIRICDEWRESFQAFYDYIGPRPGAEYSIDRIDNDGNYEPGNVRWATSVEQRHNRRDSR